jgi:uncharacterized coiled-coil protein SlyX
MNERQKRLIEVYEHLRRHFGIHTKTGFAEALHYGRTSMSAAMNGDEKYLTDSLFKNICETYQGVFDLDYLLTGKGSLLNVEEDLRSKDVESKPAPVHDTIDYTFMVEKAVEKATAYADKTIAALEKQIADKDHQIERLEKEVEVKDTTIEKLQDRILDLERLLSHNAPITDYPFPIGVADDSKLEPNRV